MKQNKLRFAPHNILAKSLAAAFLIYAGAHAEIVMPGPGVAKVNFKTNELFKFFGNPKLGVPAGKAMTAATEMINGYVIVPFGDEAEVGTGGWYFFDASKLPTELPTVKILHSTELLREQNVICFRRDTDGKIYAATMAKAGIQFHDWTDAPRTTTELSYLKLPGILEIPYEGPWWITWQGKYMYAGGVSAGLYIINAEDPANPKVVKVIPNSQIGNFRAASCSAIGNLLYMGEQDVGKGQSTLDISDPENPKLLALTNDSLSAAYSQLPIGNLLIVGGRQQGFKVFDLSVNTKIKLIGQVKEANGLAYMRFQDGYAHGGSNGFGGATNNQGGEGYWKIDIRDPHNPKAAGHIDTHLGAGGDTLLAGKNYHLDWGVPFGNFVFASDDMRFGSGVFAHTEEPDVMGPRVNMVVPRSGDVKQALTSRVGLTFTDQITPESITPENLSVMPVGSDKPLDGYYVSQQGSAHFCPKAPLLPNTTYRIVVRKGGIKDYAGNPTDTVFESQFTTGNGNSATWAAVPKASISAEATTQNKGFEAEKGIDGDPATMWHNEFDTPSSLPQDFTLTLDKSYNLAQLTYTPRQDKVVNGIITKYEIWVSEDGAKFTIEAEGLWAGDDSPKKVPLSTSARFIRLRALEGMGGFAAVAEMQVDYLVPAASIIPPWKTRSGRFAEGTKIYRDLRNILGRWTAPRLK